MNVQIETDHKRIRYAKFGCVCKQVCNHACPTVVVGHWPILLFYSAYIVPWVIKLIKLSYYTTLFSLVTDIRYIEFILSDFKETYKTHFDEHDMKIKYLF